MRNTSLVMMLSAVLFFCACQATPDAMTNPTQPAAVIETKPVAITAALPSATAIPTQTISPTHTAAQTPVFQLDLSRYDFDAQPPIDVLHNPPVIAHSSEKVKLEFHFVCKYAAQVDSYCNPSGTLFVSYGEGNKFTPTLLEEEDHDSLSVLASTLPAVDESGRPLRRYYLEVIHPQVGLEVRFPVAGAVDIFVASELIPVDLPEQKPVEAGELALGLPWGEEAEAVGLRPERIGYPWNQGPVAMDVAEDGRIALLDIVKKRILIFDPAAKNYASIPIPFNPIDYPDVQFDRNGQLAAFDPVGAPLDERSTANVPRLYRFLLDGQIDAVAPVFVLRPNWLNQGLQVFDLREVKLVNPFDAAGKANPREIQREKTSPRLTMKYMLETVNDVRFADWEKGIAFALHSASPMGGIICFEKTPQGYLAVFEGGALRAIWFDETGKVLKDVTLPREEYTEINPDGRTSVRSDGGLYYLRSTEKGIEVRFVPAP